MTNTSLTGPEILEEETQKSLKIDNEIELASESLSEINESIAVSRRESTLTIRKESVIESTKENHKEVDKNSPTKTIAPIKQSHPIMRFKKSSKNQPPLESIQEHYQDDQTNNPNLSDNFLSIKSQVSYKESCISSLKQEIVSISSPSKLDKTHSFSQKKYDNGNIYIGEWEGIYKDGRGKYIWAGGDSYEGEWRKDKQHGKGKSVWNGGMSYIGYFENDEKNGIGEFVWSDGNAYVGDWKDNKMNGIGRLRWADGREYIGEWVQGTRSGLGILVYKNKSRYEGQFKNNKPSGLGTLYEPSGKSITGDWNEGKLIKKAD